MVLKTDKSSTDNNTNLAQSVYVKVRKWESDKVNDFQNNFDEFKILEYEQNLTYLETSNHEIVNNDIDLLLDELGSIFLESASSTFGTYTPNNNARKVTKNQKPWFDRECKTARPKFRKAKRKYKRKNTVDNRIAMNEAEKKYKSILDCKYKEYCKSLEHEINTASKIFLGYS